MARPRITHNDMSLIDLTLIDRLGSIQCTDYEIADIIGMEKDAFRRRKEADQELSRRLEKARSDGCRSVRRRQYELLEQDSDKRAASTMSIWLGKQYLGQSDQVNVSGQLDTPITFNVVMIDDLSEIPAPKTPQLSEGSQDE